MKYLLDTNVISEWTKPQPNENLVRWIGLVPEDDVYISVITLAEIQFGLKLLPEGKKKARLEQWLSHDILKRFNKRILQINNETALIWGDLLSQAKNQGITLSTMDGFIAALSKQYRLTLVTRNMKDFIKLNINLLNPWDHQ
jgi:predicted nucleic acid-binding protein